MRDSGGNPESGGPTSALKPFPLCLQECSAEGRKQASPSPAKRSGTQGPIREVALDHLQQVHLVLPGETQKHGICRQSSLASQVGVTHPTEHRACRRGSAGGTLGSPVWGSWSCSLPTPRGLSPKSKLPP